MSFPGFTNHAWDLSRYLPDGASPFHWLYVLLQAMFQFNLQPTVLQVVLVGLHRPDPGAPHPPDHGAMALARARSPRPPPTTPAVVSADESDAEEPADAVVTS